MFPPGIIFLALFHFSCPLFFIFEFLIIDIFLSNFSGCLIINFCISLHPKFFLGLKKEYTFLINSKSFFSSIVSLKLDKSLLFEKLNVLNLPDFLKYGVTCSWLYLSFADIYAFFNDLKLNTSISKPSGNEGGLAFVI